MSGLLRCVRCAWLAFLACAVLALAARAAAEPQGASTPARSASADAGVELYRAGDYAAAESAWRAALAEPGGDERRALLCYDLGNAVFRQGRLAEAVGWYEAARRLAPRDADVWANLEFARRKLDWPPADRGDLRSTALRLLGSLRAGEARWLAGAGLALLAAACAWEALRGGLRARLALLAAAALALACAAPLIWQLARGARAEWIVFAPEGAALRSEPRDALAAIGKLEPGALVERIDALPGWVRVEDAGGQRGWVAADSVFALER